jgi:hypothetical protein
METPRDEELIADLQALRPTPRPEFAAGLDERAAAGFPRHRRLLPESPPVLFTAMRNKRPAHLRRLLIPAGGVALAAIVVLSTVVAMNDPEPGASDDAAKPKEARQSGAPLTFEKGLAVKPEAEALAGEAASKATGASSNLEFGRTEGRVERYFDGSAPVGTVKPFARTQSNLTRLDNRAVERNAELVLAADPADVGDDSSQVFEAVHAHDGIVLRSSTREGEAGVAGARFELLIPSGKLGDALAALSGIDGVRSRHETTDDITAPTVTTGELLADSKARIDSLLDQLAGAETEAEREAVEAELAQERRHRARLRTQLQHLERRADYSRVLVRIETGESDRSSDEGGSWGIGDALDDAGKILAVAAAVTVVAAAILGPLALVALLAWLAHRAWVRRERRRVLS